MEDIINIACKQALNNLKHKLSRDKEKDVSISEDIEETCNAGAVENKSSFDTDQVDCNVKIKIEEIKEEEEDSERTPEIDPKLLLFPTVCTTRLDNMGLFDHNSFNFVDSKELIDRIYIKSNPLKNITVKSEKKSIVESILIESSDEDSCNEESDSNDAETKNDINNYDDDRELIENNISEAERVLLSRNIFNKPQIHNYNHLELMKNPDFEKSLYLLNIDVNALVNNGTYLKNSKDKVQNKQDRNDSINQPCTSKMPSASSITKSSDYDSIISHTLDASRNPNQESNEITVTSERNRAVNLPNITEVRRFNQKLLTAEVPPVQTQNILIQTPKTSIVKPAMTSDPMISSRNTILNYHLEKAPILTDKFKLVKTKPPPLIMFPHHLVSKPNIRTNNLPPHKNNIEEKSNTLENYNATYIVTKNNVQSNNIALTAPRAVESKDATQHVTTPNGNIIVRAAKCKLHEYINTKVIENGSLVDSDQVTAATLNTKHDNNRVFLNTRQNLRVTSEPSPQSSTRMSLNTGLASEAQLLLPTRNLAPVVAPNADLNLLPVNFSTIPETNSVSETRVVFSFDEGNSRLLKSVPGRHDGGDKILNTAPFERSTKPEKRLLVSVVDQAVPDGTGNNKRNRSVESFENLQDANANTSLFHTMKLSTGNLVPYNKYGFSNINNAAPNTMTIDLTDDDEQASEVLSVAASPKKDVEEPTERSKEKKSLLIENQTKVPDAKASRFCKRVAKQNKRLDKAVAKQHYRVVLGNQVKVQEHTNKNNGQVNETEGTFRVVDSRHANVECNRRTPNKRRDSASAKLSNVHSLSERRLLKPLDTEVKSRLGNSIEDELETITEKKRTSGWVLLGL